MRRRDPLPGRADETNLAVGLGSLAAGALVTAAAFPSHSVGVLAAGAVFCGGGLGLVFVSTLAFVNAMAPDERRSGLLAIFFALLFLANSLPVVAIGFIAEVSGLPWAITGFAVVVVLVVGALLAVLARRSPFERACGSGG